jgi:hypothetical protein
MEEVFAQRYAEASGRGAGSRVRFVVREIVAAFSTGLRSRIGAARAGGTAGRGGSAGWQELRHAARRLRRSPAFTIAAVVTLGLAVGANVSIFTLVQRVVVNPLPYDGSESLVDLEHQLPGLGSGTVGMTEAMYVLYDDVASLSDIAVYQEVGRTVSAGGEPERLRAAFMTPELSSVLRVSPAAGRWFAASDVSPGAARVVVLSDRLRQRMFGGESPIGRTVDINGMATEVIGSMPASFTYPRPEVDLWLPLSVDRVDPQVGGFNYRGIGRLADGDGIVALAAELDRLIATLPARYPVEIATSLVESGRLRATPVSSNNEACNPSPTMKPGSGAGISAGGMAALVVNGATF